VIEANSIVEIDYTAAKVVGDGIRRLRDEGIEFAVARLESLRAQNAFARLGLDEAIGGGRLFHSVEEAVRALTPHGAT
jgi:SulP family sulfate permease